MNRFPLMTVGVAILVAGLTIDRLAPPHSWWQLVAMLCGSLGFLLLLLGERKLLKR